MSAGPLRVAIVADLLSERWPSMDLVADMLFDELRHPRYETRFQVEMLRPEMPERRSQLGRYINRYWDYTRWVKRRAADFEVFYVADHSYAHLVHVLPCERTVVTCHDTDAFMPLVDPAIIPSRLPKVVTRRVLTGLRKAACVTCDSRATRDELLQFGLVAADRLAVVPLGVHRAFTERASSGTSTIIDQLLGPPHPARIELLHVGSCIPRKRIDVLLRVVAAIREIEPRATLVKAGGSLTDEQRALARDLGLDQHIVELPFLETATLAALYRRASVTLVTSAREGFGLPIAEALAAGAPVVANDIPVLRETGGEAVSFVPLDDIERWRAVVLSLLSESGSMREQRSQAGRNQAVGFNWTTCAASFAGLFERVVANARAGATASA